jgi:membrane protease YdiL (CAAX protease family)
LVRRVQGHELLTARPQSEAPWGLLDLWIIMMFWFVGGTMISAISAIKPGDKFLFGFGAAVATLLATAAGVAWLLLRYRGRVAERLLVRQWRHDVWVGIVSFFAVVPPIFWLMSLLVQFLPYQHETLDQIKASPTVLVILSSFFSAALTAPIGEEFFFRFVLQSWLQRLRFPDLPSHRLATIYGDAKTEISAAGAEGRPIIATRSPLRLWPIALSAAAFAALHLGQGPAPIALFVLGIALGYIFQKTGSLLPSIVLHACLNLYSLTWESLAAIEQSTLHGMAN